MEALKQLIRDLEMLQANTKSRHDCNGHAILRLKQAQTLLEERDRDLAVRAAKAAPEA